MSSTSLPGRALAGAAILAVAAGSLAAQTASYTLVGTSCTTGRLTAALGPVPFRAIGTPKLGGSFSIETEGSARYPWGNARQVLLLTGASNQWLGPVPLPFDIALLAPRQPFCGLLRTSADFAVRAPNVVDHTAPTQVVLPVPNVAALLGLSFYQQALSIESSSFGPPFVAWALSAGGHGVFGR
jgi:hypothetical protein